MVHPQTKRLYKYKKRPLVWRGRCQCMASGPCSTPQEHRTTTTFLTWNTCPGCSPDPRGAGGSSTDDPCPSWRWRCASLRRSAPPTAGHCCTGWNSNGSSESCSAGWWALAPAWSLAGPWQRPPSHLGWYWSSWRLPCTPSRRPQPCALQKHTRKELNSKLYIYTWAPSCIYFHKERSTFIPCFSTTLVKIQTSNGLAVSTLHEYEQQTQDIPLLRTFQLSNTVHHPYQSVQCVCLCVQIFFA